MAMLVARNDWPRTGASSLKSEDSNCSKSSSNASNSDSNGGDYCCKWTHCDWPGAKDDLVDHIREIHVELQPYQQQKYNWTEVQTKTKANNKSQTISKSIDKMSADSCCSSSSSSLSADRSGSSSPSADRSGSSSPSADRSDGSTSAATAPILAKRMESSHQQKYVCLWEGCKVYGKGSSSRNWLERHVLEQHSGPRPFKCIVEGCGQRFKVQSALERHVNSHFKPSVDWFNSNCSPDVCPNGSTNCFTNSADNHNLCPDSVHGLSPFELHLRQTARATMSAVRCKTSVDSTATHQHICKNGTPNKILKRKKSNQKVRRKCFIVKCSEDYFDESIMEQVRYGLIQLNAQTGLDISGTQTTITFHSEVIARRENVSGEVTLLLKWEPNDILPDVWVPEDKVSELKSKTVPVSALPANSLAQLVEENIGAQRKPKTKQRRK